MLEQTCSRVANAHKIEFCEIKCGIHVASVFRYACRGVREKIELILDVQSVRDCARDKNVRAD